MRPGESSDFAEFVAARGDALARTAYLLTGNKANAEDLVQTVLLRLYRRWSRLDHTTSPEAYARRALLNTWLSWRHRVLLRETAVERVPDPPVADSSAAMSARVDLLAALRRLPPQQRAAVVLRYFDDLTEADTAALLGCSVGTVKSQTSDALRSLRRILDAPALDPSTTHRRTRP